MNYRSQGRSITPNNYVTSSFSIDMPLFEHFGLGLFVLNSSAGDGNLKTLDGKMSIAYNQTIGRKKYHHVLLGVQGGLIARSIDFSKLIFDNQIIDGIYDPSTSNGERFGSNSISFLDYSMGLFWYYDKRMPTSGMVPFAGCAIYHLTEPNQSFLNRVSLLSNRISIITGTKIIMSESFFIAPQVLFMRQNTAQEINAGVMTDYTANSNSFLFGASYRFNDALIATTGVEYKNVTFGFSYDVNVSKLNAATNYNGGFELSIIYLGGERSSNSIPLIPCFRF